MNKAVGSFLLSVVVLLGTMAGVADAIYCEYGYRAPNGSYISPTEPNKKDWPSCQQWCSTQRQDPAKQKDADCKLSQYENGKYTVLNSLQYSNDPQSPCVDPSKWSGGRIKACGTYSCTTESGHTNIWKSPDWNGRYTYTAVTIYAGAESTNQQCGDAFKAGTTAGKIK